jgi:Flp pilus assembly protein TadB
MLLCIAAGAVAAAAAREEAAGKRPSAQQQQQRQQQQKHKQQQQRQQQQRQRGSQQQQKEDEDEEEDEDPMGFWLRTDRQAAVAAEASDGEEEHGMPSQAAAMVDSAPFASCLAASGGPAPLQGLRQSSGGVSCRQVAAGATWLLLPQMTTMMMMLCSQMTR